MNPILGGILAGMAIGAAKNYLIDRPKAEKSRKLQSEIARYSPWTGHQAQTPETSSLWGNLLGGGASGLVMGLNASANKAEPSKLSDQQQVAMDTQNAQLKQALQGTVGNYGTTSSFGAVNPATQNPLQQPYSLLTPAQMDLGSTPNPVVGPHGSIWEQLYNIRK